MARMDSQRLKGRAMADPDLRAMAAKRAGPRGNIGAAAVNRGNAQRPARAIPAPEGEAEHLMAAAVNRKKPMAKGGRACAKPKKMAMGGVGKIRHGQATAAGAPKSPKRR